jgi:hypothetical protein
MGKPISKNRFFLFLCLSDYVLVLYIVISTNTLILFTNFNSMMIYEWISQHVCILRKIHHFKNSLSFRSTNHILNFPFGWLNIPFFHFHFTIVWRVSLNTLNHYKHWFLFLCLSFLSIPLILFMDFCCNFNSNLSIFLFVFLCVMWLYWIKIK